MSGVLPTSAETVVVGAGIIGLTTALHLARAGREVVVIDKAEPWREGSAVNAGTCALQNKVTDLLPAYRLGLAEWRRLVAEMDGDFGFINRGGLRVAQSAEDVAALRYRAAEQAAQGVELEWLEGNALRDRAPWLSPSVTAATFCADDSFASPLLTGQALIRAIRSEGGQVVVAALTDRREKGDGYDLLTEAGTLSCRNVVVAAGPWSDRVASLFGIHLPVSLNVNTLSVTERTGQFMDNLVVTHIAGRFTLKQFPNGSCILGGGFQGRGDKDTGRKELDLDQLQANIRYQCSVVPQLQDLTLLRSWVGFTAIATDGRPTVGPTPGRPGLFFAFSTNAGFSIGPYVGRIVSEAVMGRTMPAIAHDWTPGRFIA
ncbi:MAG: FAD-binding oxidoreductase [Alphaproteobacteria bacterium]|nr:FAD-binding oxidoreductase [Alphaproteobacteria bacterium]